MDNDFFGDEELALLRSHGIALFARRVIFDARPPIFLHHLGQPCLA